MNTLVYHLEADKIDQKFIDSIKAFYGHKKIEISVKEEMSLDSLIERNLKSDTHYEFTAEEFDNIADKILNDEVVDYQIYKKTKA